MWLLHVKPTLYDRLIAWKERLKLDTYQVVVIPTVPDSATDKG